MTRMSASPSTYYHELAIWSSSQSAGLSIAISLSSHILSLLMLSDASQPQAALQSNSTAILISHVIALLQPNATLFLVSHLFLLL